jgi:kynureninase
MNSPQIVDNHLLTSRLTIFPKVTLPQTKEKEISLTNTMTADYKGGLCVG